MKPFPNFSAEQDAVLLRKAMKGLGEYAIYVLHLYTSAILV